jgi:hypothetical protein
LKEVHLLIQSIGFLQICKRKTAWLDAKPAEIRGIV